MNINSVAPDAAFKRNVINGGRGEGERREKEGTEDDSFHVYCITERDPYPVRLSVRLLSTNIVVLPRRRRSSSIVVGDKLKEEGRRTEKEMKGTSNRSLSLSRSLVLINNCVIRKSSTAAADPIFPLSFVRSS